jgi:hypothetical protein
MDKMQGFCVDCARRGRLNYKSKAELTSMGMMPETFCERQDVCVSRKGTCSLWESRPGKKPRMVWPNDGDISMRTSPRQGQPCPAAASE